MKLNVENFGPINKAKNIEVSPMTVFVGPSNTGKSYLATLIYSIMKVFEEPHHQQDLYSAIGKRMKGKELNFASMIKNGHLISIEEVDEYFFSWATSISAHWKKQLVFCFGEEGMNMIRGNGKSKGNINLITISDANEKLVIDLYDPERSKIAMAKKRKLCDYISHVLSERVEEDSSVDTVEDDISYFHQIQDLYAVMLSQNFSLLLFDTKSINTETISYYLPAVRGGIMQIHRAIVGSLIDRAAVMMPSNPLFNGVLSNFMRQLINTSDENPKKYIRFINSFPRRFISVGDRQSAEETTEIGRALEAEIMEGTIKVKKTEAQYPDFHYLFKKDGEEYNLPMMSASSMISELAPVSLFLRHYVIPGDLFIIEEPEAHLHPAAERDITKILVKLVNAGVFVLITTHSDYILEQLGNYVHAAGIGKSLHGVSLSEEKISAYWFDKSKRTKHKKTNVKLVSFDDEMGFVTEDHSDVSSALYNESVDLFNARERIAEARKTNDA